MPIIAHAQNIYTIAGDTTWGYSGDGGLATLAECKQTTNVAFDTLGNIFFADCLNNRIRKINPAGIITTVAGNGSEGYSADGISATASWLDLPWGIAVDGAGNLFIGDRENHRIRKVNTSGIISTIAGTGLWGYSGDGGPAVSAQVNGPRGVIVDKVGNVYFADAENHRVRKINTSGVISTFAGNGYPSYLGDGGPATAANLFYPSGLAMDTIGNIFIADQYNHRIRKVNTAGIITTVAGNGTHGYTTDGIAATASEINYPLGVAVDLAGNIYIGDEDNSRIRKVNTAGIISTIAGTGAAGFSGDGYAATTAQVNRPDGVAVDAAGNIYIADEINHCIREITTPLPPIEGPATVCLDSNITLTDSIPGGVWSSGNPAVAGIGSSSGIVSGGSPGVDTITYRLGLKFVTTVITVNPLPLLSSTLTPPSLCDTAFFDYTPTSLTPGTIFSWSRSALTGISNPANSGIGNPHELLTDTTSGPVTVTYVYTLDAGGCNNTQNVIVIIEPCNPSLMIIPASSKNQSISIHPNPVTTTLTLSSQTKIISVTITDLPGKIVFSKSFNSQQVEINVNNLPSGVYLLKINNIFVRKFIKE